MKRFSTTCGHVCTSHAQNRGFLPGLYIFVSADKQYLRKQKQEEAFMRSNRFLYLALAVVLALGLTRPVMAAEVDCDATYCFTAGDFHEGEEALAGICITGLPESSTGTVMLGSRVLRCGDIEINCSIGLILSQMRDTLEGDVYRILFN